MLALKKLLLAWKRNLLTFRSWCTIVILTELWKGTHYLRLFYKGECSSVAGLLLIKSIESLQDEYVPGFVKAPLYCQLCEEVFYDK